MNSLIGHLLNDRYQIQSLLGRQVGRRTFLATDLTTQTLVVLKLLLFGPDFTWDDLKLFEREADTLKSLDYPSIPKYFDSFELETELGSGFGLVQSYIEARSLQDWIDSGRNFSEAELKAIATQLLDVLIYLHCQQPPVIHRDIKPSNILLDDNRSGHSPGQVYVVDFGSVQTLQHSGTLTIVGTYGYMPPEQFGGRTGPASDLYSLGATVIYLLTRTHPADLPLRNGRLQFKASSQVSASFEAWLKCLIQPECERRFSSAQLALTALNDKHFIAPTYLPLPAKPADSKIEITKTNDQIQIVIPPLGWGRKLEVIYTNIYTNIGHTLNCCLFLLYCYILLLLGLQQPLIFWLFFPIVSVSFFGYLRKFRKIAEIFETRQLQINQCEIQLTQCSFGFKKIRSAPRQHILKIEHFSHASQPSKTQHWQNDKGTKPITSTLGIWAGNQYFAIGDTDLSYGIKWLTEVELDWLAVELSEWLELPIQTVKYDVKAPCLLNGNDFSLDKKDQEAPFKTSNLAKVDRPMGAQCTLNKYDDRLEISAPEVLKDYWLCFGCLGYFIFVVSFPFLLVLLASEQASLWVAFLLGILPVSIWQIRRLLDGSPKYQNIITRVEQNWISIWRQAKSEKILRRVHVDDVYGVQIAYKIRSSETSDQYAQKNYHVQLKVADSLPEKTSGCRFLVGNREFWLSRKEAYWLASELSSYLNVPVTELEMIEHPSV
jgi:serine/threonine protein kinase